jgi:hypothetical protein
MARTAEGLLNTSVDDCRIDLPTVTDLGLLRRLLVLCQQNGHASRYKLVAARIKQLKKEAA